MTKFCEVKCADGQIVNGRYEAAGYFVCTSLPLLLPLVRWLSYRAHPICRRTGVHALHAVWPARGAAMQLPRTSDQLPRRLQPGRWLLHEVVRLDAPLTLQKRAS